ncbi:MAG: DUF309 domain-containing protein [Deltaproteobacteria bacterium]|nr:DUF309 domain-containing protein [Deltaproteobacteria bacterium]
MESSEHFQKGITLFNEEKFYEAHEEWEVIWLKDRSEDRYFLQGLIQLAGAFHHRQKGREGPAQTALAKALSKLEKYPAQHWGIDLARLIREARKNPKIHEAE